MTTSYVIKDLEHLTGIKAHTIRMWEQRYGILQPTRSATNIRYYSGEDLKALLNIAVLNRQGIRISQIAEMSAEQIEGEVEQSFHALQDPDGHVDSLVISMIELDEGRFEKVIHTASLRWGFEAAMLQVVFPFLDRIGIMWQTGSISPAHEHFISALVRQKIIVAIDGQYSRPGGAQTTAMLFLPEGEWHELTLLFMAYLLKKRGHRVIYLGASVPMDNLVSVGRDLNPDWLYWIATTYPSAADLEDYLLRLGDAFPGKNIAMSGLRFRQYHGRLPARFRLLEDQEAVVAFVNSMGSEN